ncbi:hypothetical protein [Sphingomonas sp. MMS24-J13]|uniref:hypothetical protein n=1 Tax=Sphingomonas sp. MMS24-J13 TaxID=3238686 RepID=UPI00384CA1D4
MLAHPLLPLSILGFLAAGLTLPLLAGPPRLDDSHWINLVWSDQFTALLKQGELWPRWLPWSHDGLGAPVFYFYGPVAFWLAGLFGLAGSGLWPSLVLAAFVALLASGIGTYIWLRGRAPHPLAGAAFYMIAPYHLLDFLRRGALAEFTAAALLPFVALGIARAIEGKPAVLPLAFAGLIMSHLPLAVLAAAFLVPMLIAMERGIDRRGVARVAAGLGIGAALACAYWLPALWLQRFTAMETMRGAPLLQPANWSPATYAGAPGLVLLGVAGLSLLPLAASMRRDRWAWFVLGTLCLAFGLARPLWLLPPLDRVQFPWRILTLAEFGAAMLIARSRLPGPAILAAAAPPLLCSILIAMSSFAAGPESARSRLAALQRDHPDVIEYLPHGLGERAGSHSDWALDLARRTPAITQAGGVTTLRRFAFPIWQVRCGDRLAQTSRSPEGLLQYRGSLCTIERTKPLAERLGLAVSAAALLGLIALSRTRRPQPRNDPLPTPQFASRGI